MIACDKCDQCTLNAKISEEGQKKALKGFAKIAGDIYKRKNLFVKQKYIINIFNLYS